MANLVRYGSLSTRRVDLVGDYAGQELFAVEGDSLLLRCFTDPRLDFDGECSLYCLSLEGVVLSQVVQFSQVHRIGEYLCILKFLSPVFGGAKGKCFDGLPS